MRSGNPILDILLDSTRSKKERVDTADTLMSIDRSLALYPLDPEWHEHINYNEDVFQAFRNVGYKQDSTFRRAYLSITVERIER